MTVSVVIPVFGTLDSTTAATLAGADEVIVVDDGNVRPVPPISGARVVRIDRPPEHRTPGHARNCGARAARGDIVLFCDATVRPVVDAVRSLAAMAERGALAVAFVGEWPSVDVETAALDFPWPSRLLPVEHALAAVPRADFLALGGYDTAAFPRWGFESHDLTLRWLDSGRPVSFCPPRTCGKLSTVGFHRDHPAPRDVVAGNAQFARRWGRSYGHDMLRERIDR